MLVKTPFGAYTVPRLHGRAITRLRTSRQARTRLISLLASQSILRTRTGSIRSSLLSPDVLLMHFSVLSLLDTVHEHDKGKKTSSKKALHTAILVEPPSSDAEASSSSTPENQESQPSPIAALAGFSSSSSTKSSNASSYAPSTSFSSSLALQHPSSSSIPPNKLASLPEETRSSPQLATFFSDNSKNITAQRYRQLAALKLRQRIEDLVYQVKPHILPSGTRKSMDILPALQACKLIHRQIVVDSRHGINPLTNIDEGIITILLSMADLNPTRESRAILQHVDLLDKHLELVHSLRQYPALNKWHEALPQTMEESYTSILSKEVFSILEQLQPGNLATVIAAVDQVEPLSDGVLEHALRVAQNLNEPALAIIAWASHSVIRKPILQREEIQHLLHAHLPIFSTFIWPGLLESLSLSHLQNQDQEEKHAKAIYAYEAIFEYIKIHTPSKRYMYETLLQTLMHLPVPPESAESSGKKREVESVVKHEELFKASHSFLLETLQGVLGSVGSDAPPLDHTYDISFQDNTWVMTQKAIEQVTGESIEPTVRPSPEALKTISRHSQALSALLIYAYRHLQSKEVGERLYETWILRGLRRRWDRLPSEESESPRLQTDKLKARKIASGFEKYLTLVQEVESIRIRGATLLRDDEAATQAINASLELIASHTGMEDYTPLPQSKKPISQLQARKNAALEQRRYRHWQADVLLRCTSISNAYVSAVLMYWCTTTDYSACRYFIHHFFSMRNNLRPSQIQSPTGMINLHSLEVDEIPPLGNEIPIKLASERIKRLMSNSEIITTLLHAAQKMGNLSLAEKCWLVACEEEESRGQNWKLPPAAYTSILQAYADEAHRERKYTPDPSAIEKPKNIHDEKNSHLRSRITRGERSKLVTEGKQAWNVFARAVYRRFASRMSLQDADPRFFNAALELFGFGRKNIQLIATEYADSQADQSTTDIEEAFDDSDSYPETSDSSQETASVSKSADVDTRFLGTIAKDIVNAGHPLPAWLEPYLNNDSDGLLEAGNGSSPFYDTRQRPPLLQWTSQARNIKNNPFIPFFQDRGLSRDRWKSLSRSQNP